MPKKTDPAAAGFTPIEVEPHVDEAWEPIEVTPYTAVPAEPVSQPASPAAPVKSPGAGENKEN